MIDISSMKVVGAIASAVVAVPITTTLVVYKDKIFGARSEEDTYWKFFYFLLKNKRTSAITSNSWEKFREQCKDWTMNKSGKSFQDIESDECSVIAAFNRTHSTDWGKHLGYFNQFKSEGWNNKEIDYSTTNSPNYFKTIFQTFESNTNSTNVTDESKNAIYNEHWNPSKR